MDKEIAGVAFGVLGDDGWLQVFSTNHQIHQHPNGHPFSREAWDASEAAMPQPRRGISVMPYYHPERDVFEWREQVRPLTHEEQLEEYLERIAEATERTAEAVSQLVQDLRERVG